MATPRSSCWPNRWTPRPARGRSPARCSTRSVVEAASSCSTRGTWASPRTSPARPSKVNSAELAAIDAANRSNSFATGVLGAADTLGVKGSAGSGSGTGDSGGQDLGASGRVDREHPAGRAPRGPRGAGRRRVLPLVVVAQAEGGRRHGVERLPGRGRADRPGRGRGELEPGHRPGRSDRGPRRAGRGRDRVPRRRLRVRRAAGRPRGRGHPPGAGGGVPPPCARAVEAGVLEGPPRRATRARRADPWSALPSSAAPAAGRGSGPAGPGAPLPAPHAAQPLAHRRGDHRHHGPRLPRVWRAPGPHRGDSRATTSGSATGTAARVVAGDRRGGGRQSGSQSRPPISMGGQRGRGMGDR